jgi:hypothetical protein
MAAAALTVAVAPAAMGSTTGSATPSTAGPQRGNCATNVNWCTEVSDSEQVFGEDVYVGHDEPAANFYGSTPGAGNDVTYTIRLPKDPPQQPKQDGSGATWNFQLHPAFWFGMAMCDDQSAPAPGLNATCKPDSDNNIYTDSDPSSPRYIGRHPGGAYMEMQFYPPGWSSFQNNGVSCAAAQWCAALNIDGLSENQNTGTVNNNACETTVGTEFVDFAYITRNGQATSPANPANGARFNIDPARDLFMRPGDVLTVHLFDTVAGFRVDINDLSSGQHGSMTASTANGFAQVLFQPTATTCTTVPHAFHPMYATSSEKTRLAWTAHTYNTAFSDEIGHFEYCAAADPTTGNCTTSAGTEPVDADDNFCFNPSDSLLVRIGGCVGETPTDDDYDGVSYQDTWPGSGSPAVDRATKPQPVLFTSPLIHGYRQFDRVAFETDLPRIEDNGTLVNPCNRTTGANCVNPPPGARFYPFYTTRNVAGTCAWQLGGGNIPGTVNRFGGSSATEFGALLPVLYPNAGNKPVTRINDFRQVLPMNPCQAFAGGDTALASAQ